MTMKVLLIVLALCAVGAAQKKAEVQVVSTKAMRSDDRILVDCRVRVVAKPLRGLVVYFDLLSPENGVVTTQKAVLDDERVQPGQERTCHSALPDEPRAVRFKIRASDLGERELRVGNDGPFPIE
jgi:hypothetical protein